jgi:hypothetical protein
VINSRQQGFLALFAGDTGECLCFWLWKNL